MSLTMLSLVSPMMMALADFNEPLKLANVYLFEPPKCEHQVIFPHQPQNVGVLRYDEQTYSAQLKLPDSFLRADCSSLSISDDYPRTELLESMMLQQINQLGGSRVMILEYSISEHVATYTGQVVLNNASIMVNGAFYLGEHSVMTLTAIDKYKTQSSPVTKRFIASATHFE